MVIPSLVELKFEAMAVSIGIGLLVLKRTSSGAVAGPGEGDARLLDVIPVQGMGKLCSEFGLCDAVMAKERELRHLWDFQLPNSQQATGIVRVNVNTGVGGQELFERSGINRK